MKGCCNDLVALGKFDAMGAGWSVELDQPNVAIPDEATKILRRELNHIEVHRFSSCLAAGIAASDPNTTLFDTIKTQQKAVAKAKRMHLLIL